MAEEQRLIPRGAVAEQRPFAQAVVFEAKAFFFLMFATVNIFSSFVDAFLSFFCYQISHSQISKMNKLRAFN